MSNQVEFEHLGITHKAMLIDDGTMDTVIEVDGSQHKFSAEYAARFRTFDGRINDLSVKELAMEVIDYMEKG